MIPKHRKRKAMIFFIFCMVVGLKNVLCYDFKVAQDKKALLLWLLCDGVQRRSRPDIIQDDDAVVI